MDKFKYLAVITAGLLTNVGSYAQGLPPTQVWLAEIVEGIPSEPALISPDSRYNNQPMFSPDGSTIYFTAEQEDGQTDVARYQIENGILSLIGESPESEYSPTPIPGQKAVSVIRVEPPDQLQRLWGISTLNGDSWLLMPKVEPVGYHTWLDSESVAVFILGDSFTLHRATVGDSPSVLLADNIGRTLRTHPGNGNILFVDKNTEPWAIASFDLVRQKQTQVLSLFPGIEDFEVDNKGRYWMGFGSKLYRSNEANTDWELTADFQALGLKNITRLASSPDGNMLAIVASP